MEKKRNLWVIPTDKPSRLSYDFDIKQYYLQNKPSFFEHQDLIENREIYITSDEDIKEGDEESWCILNGELIKIKAISKSKHCIYFGDGIDGSIYACKKIILTTDQDLIKNGVQAIDDEFLEWFIKSPSYEEVETDEYPRFDLGKGEYKIIIPKEDETEHLLSTETNKNRLVEEIIGIKAHDYSMQYAGTAKYTVAMLAIEFGYQLAQEQNKNKYSDEDMVKFVSFVGKNYIKAKGFYYMKGDFEKSMKVSIHQILEQFKKK